MRGAQDKEAPRARRREEKSQEGRPRGRPRPQDFPADPLLRRWHPDPFARWEPQLGEGDFLGVYKSNWASVARSARATAGHLDGSVHFYAVVGWRLPAEICDQLAHVLKTNPRGETWAQLARGYEFRNAEDLARRVRERLLTAFVRATRLAPKAACPAPVHTVADVLRIVTVKSEAEEEERERAVFYAGAACTQADGPGVLVMTNSDPAKPIVWYHGPRVAGTVGGGRWAQHACAHAFPVFGRALKPGKALLGAMAKVGYKEKWGVAKLENVVLV